MRRYGRLLGVAGGVIHTIASSFSSKLPQDCRRRTVLAGCTTVKHTCSVFRVQCATTRAIAQHRAVDLKDRCAPYLNRSRAFPRSQDRLKVDLKTVIVQPGGAGQRLAHALRLSHGSKECKRSLLVCVVQRGELLGVIECRHNRFDING